MSKKLTLAAAALFTAALFGMNAPSATAQFGGFVNVNAGGVSISLGANTCNTVPCDDGFFWRTERRRIWRPAVYRDEWVGPIYRTHYDSCGRPVRVLVRAGFNRRVLCTAGHWDWVDHRVRVRRPAPVIRPFHRGGRNRGGIVNRGHRNNRVVANRGNGGNRGDRRGGRRGNRR